MTYRAAIAAKNEITMQWDAIHNMEWTAATVAGHTTPAVAVAPTCLQPQTWRHALTATQALATLARGIKRYFQVFARIH